MGLDASHRGEQERKAAETYLPSPIWSQWTKTLEETLDTVDTSKGWGTGEPKRCKRRFGICCFSGQRRIGLPKTWVNSC